MTHKSVGFDADFKTMTPKLHFIASLETQSEVRNPKLYWFQITLVFLLVSTLEESSKVECSWV